MKAWRSIRVFLKIWKGITVQRRWRNAEYIITVTNPDDVEKGVKKILLNGKEIFGVIPAKKAASKSEIAVIMGV